MTVIDRYIIRLFLLNFAILFVVVVAMIVLSDLLIFNLDEFMQAAQIMEDGGWWARTARAVALVVDFWGPMTFLLYNYLVGLVPVGAAGFTLWTMIRNRELVALLAGGVSLYRVALPMLAVGFGLNLLMVVNQELILPPLAHKLSRSQADLKRADGYQAFELRLTSDGEGSLFAGTRFNPRQGVIEGLTVLRRRPLPDGRYGPATERITAERAEWDPDAAGGSGWRLTGGRRVWIDLNLENPDEQATTQHSEPMAFLPSKIDPVRLLLHHQARFAQLLSMRDLLAIEQTSGSVDPAMLRRTLHSRFSLVVINMLILAMSLPFFLQRAPRSLLMPVMQASALGVGAWGTGLLMLQIPPTYFLSPVAVAWLPVAIYLPIAWWLMDGVET